MKLGSGGKAITPESWVGPAAQMWHLRAQPLNFGTLASYVRLQVLCFPQHHASTAALGADLSSNTVLTHCR